MQDVIKQMLNDNAAFKEYLDLMDSDVWAHLYKIFNEKKTSISAEIAYMASLSTYFMNLKAEDYPPL